MAVETQTGRGLLQNSNQARHLRTHAGYFDTRLSCQAACNLVFKGLAQPSDYRMSPCISNFPALSRRSA